MKSLLGFAILIIGCSERVHLQELQNENDENNQNLPAVSSDSEENETASETKSQLSDEALISLFAAAKNISHSKGIYQKSDKSGEAEDEREIRRSIHRKAVITSASDVMQSILKNIKSGVKKLALLEHLEHLVHEFDVAVNFANQGGIEVVTPLLFSPNNDFASYAALILGSAMQSNPIVQKLAVKCNVGTNLLKLLAHESPVVLSRVIFALGAFLRNSPKSQDEFIAVEGISKLAKVLKNPEVSSSTKLKILTLFNDLVVEEQTAERNSKDNSLQVSPLKRLISIELKINGICELIPALLHLEGVDAHQKTVSAMISLKSMCGNDFQSEKAIDIIKHLLSLYDPDTDDTDSYAAVDIDLKRIIYSELKLLLNSIIQVKIPELRKSEL